MGLMDRLTGWMNAHEYQPQAGRPDFPVQAYSTIDLARDVGFPDFMRGGHNLAGASVNRRMVMRNTAVKRSVNLLSNSVAMLPCQLFRNDSNGRPVRETEHALSRILAKRANRGQDAFQFRKLMQRWVLIDGNAYALIIRGRNGIEGLRPIHPSLVTAKQRDDWTVYYEVRNKAGGRRTVESEEMFHLYFDSDDGFSGISLMDEAGDALGIALQADRAAARLFKHGALIRDVLSHEKRLSPEAIENLKGQVEEKFGGAENAAKTLVLEEGMKYNSVTANAKDSQHLETRNHQIEEIARIFGMPRPFLAMDDTSWGSGIEQLGIYFTTYTLAPWLLAWEQAMARMLLTDADERNGLYIKFNEKALLRGSMTDQAEFISKMMGAGGSPQILEQNEARALLEFPEHADGFGLNNGAVGGANGTTGQD
jgi:HK97 family phage portal protein